MPHAGGALRADQLALVSGLAHERSIDPRLAELLAECEAETGLTNDASAAANLREIRRDYDRAVRLPGTLVREFAQVTALAQQAWRDARERDDFASFAPWLERVLRLSTERAEHLRADPDRTLYETLLDEYEPDAREAELEGVFAALRDELTPLIGELTDASDRHPGGAVQKGAVPVAAQAELNESVLRQIGFDLAAGRLDISTHPFCQGIGDGDTRLTTRYREDDFTDSLSSALHEGGHGLYEQGLPKAGFPGQPLSEATSLGIHESQSRLWENQVGRGRAFWSWARPRAASHFGSALDGVGPDDLYAASNVVRPNLIRVESDEATYNLHILLRFDLERALLSGDLAVADLPEAWNARIRQDLGLEVPDDRRGCLQDIHWAMGGIGYFPTYTLGNLYAAQFWAAALAELGGLEEAIARGDFQPLLEWLRAGIHRHGRRYTPGELCERVTGAPLSPAPMLTYLAAKLRPLYGLS